MQAATTGVMLSVIGAISLLVIIIIIAVIITNNTSSAERMSMPGANYSSVPAGEHTLFEKPMFSDATAGPPLYGFGPTWNRARETFKTDEMRKGAAPPFPPSFDRDPNTYDLTIQKLLSV